jgi:hypothetical protein
VESESGPLGRADEGTAILLVMIVVLVLAGLAFAAVSLADLEGVASASDARALGVAYAADAAVERAIHDISVVTDWTTAVNGPAESSLYPRDPQLRAPWGELLDISAMTADVQREPDSGVGANQARWRVFLAGPLSAMLPDTPPDVVPYVVVWVGDDEADGDGNPMIDTNQVLRVRARALGPRGVRADREAVIERVAPAGVVRVRSRWQPR